MIRPEHVVKDAIFVYKFLSCSVFVRVMRPFVPSFDGTRFVHFVEAGASTSYRTTPPHGDPLEMFCQNACHPSKEELAAFAFDTLKRIG